MTDLHQSPLHKQFQALDASFGSVADWSVPLSFTGPLDEASAAMHRAAVFDLSPLGRLRIRGDGAVDLLERTCTHDVARQEDDTTVHTLLLTDRGTVLEEALLTRLENYWVLTTNPGNREKVLQHLQTQDLPDARVDDQTFKVGQIAVVGPQAKDHLTAVLSMSLENLPRGSARQGAILVANYIASRTGLSAAWSLEAMLPNILLAQAWSFITRKAGDDALPPAGWTARDVLRQQAGLCSYGRELSEAIDPLSAGLDRCLREEQTFIGADALETLRKQGPARRRVHLRLPAPGPEQTLADTLPRQGTALSVHGRDAGAVTSASLTADGSAILAQAYLAADLVEPGQAVQVHLPAATAEAELLTALS